MLVAFFIYNAVMQCINNENVNLNWSVARGM